VKVLIVEDDPAKAIRLAAVAESAGINRDDLVGAGSSLEAKALMRIVQYDLVLLDLNIPKRSLEEPVAGEGVRLLEEITARPKFMKPRNVIGVTALDEELKSAQPVFDAALVSIFRYERESEDWVAPLRRRIEYLRETVSSSGAADEVGYDYDVGIITALPTPELAAVLNLTWNWHEENYAADDTSYHVGSADLNNGTIRIVAAHSPLMGMAMASIVATKMIARFRPKYLIHCGIAAGVRGQAEIGDVLVADPSWDWGSGKLSIEGEQVVFYSAPYQIALREDLRGLVRRIAGDETTLHGIRSAWTGQKPPTVLSVRLGPVASGATVLADGLTKDRIRDQHRKLAGIDMETYGILAAAEFAAKPRPLAISMKAVCDFADGEKNDEYQPYAAYTSASIVRVLVEKYLSARRDDGV
jgi:nucleoside phosphorylase